MASRLDSISRAPLRRWVAFVLSSFLALVTFTSTIFAGSAAAQEALVTRVADDVYFLFDFNGSNSVFLVTEKGVLLIDTRTHPREGNDLLDRIRKVTDKPIKWVINSQYLRKCE
jgi:glyoxylase-like metal-dependent hydrolase (beta-lactamase superfamily II)